MDRRSFMGSAAGAAAGMALGSRPRASAKKPNIIIIMADDLGYGDLGCYGSRAIATPNLDSMARQGVKLTSFFSSAAVCSPSRAGLLTGRYPVRTGVTGVFFPSRNPATPAIHAASRLPPGMNTEEITIAQVLKTRGYATACIGKWHLGDMKRYRPNHRGFDHYFGLLYSNDMTPLPLYRNDETVEKSPVNQDFLTKKYTEEAVRFIENNRDGPFLLYLPHTFPHVPLHASPEFRGRSAGGLYGDCVEEIDWSTGEIMKTLDRLGIAGDTFMFFTSDNGPWYQGSTGGLRERKGNIFEGGMRAPAIARWPGVIPAGITTDQPSMNLDLFATAAAMAGAELPGDRPMDGKDILPMLRGGESPHQALFFYAGRELQAVRAGNWKYHRRHKWWTSKHFMVSRGPMLFNLDDDPDESYNVMGLYPDVARELDELMNRWEKGLVKGVPEKYREDPALSRFRIDLPSPGMKHPPTMPRG